MIKIVKGSIPGPAAGGLSVWGLHLYSLPFVQRHVEVIWWIWVPPSKWLACVSICVRFLIYRWLSTAYPTSLFEIPCGFVAVLARLILFSTIHKEWAWSLSVWFPGDNYLMTNCRKLWLIGQVPDPLALESETSAQALAGQLYSVF